MTARLLTILTLAATAALGVAGPASAAKKKSKAPKLPTVSKIEPLTLGIGDKLTLRGKNFVSGTFKNTVVFKRDGKRAIFVKADSATTRKITVTVPDKLKPWMATTPAGDALPTRFRIRVLARRFGKKYSATKASPLIAPTSTRQGGTSTDGLPTGGPAPAGPADCDRDGQADAVDADDDNDLLTDAFETSIGTSLCSADTDGDGLWDYWEYQSALDLNLRALPYPSKRPYPNALFADSGVDYDGDGMVAWQEQEMWQRAGRPGTLNYSDGTQTTDVASGLTDDDRDFDADGIANWTEANGPGQRGWWSAVYSQENQYGVEYASLDFLDPDSDGDGRKDGADDVDHDGWANADELDRSTPFAGTDGSFPRWVQPFNPCLPDPDSITCSLHPPFPWDKSWAPFKELQASPIPQPPTIERPLRAARAPLPG
jgi:hypothetical protein